MLLCNIPWFFVIYKHIFQEVQNQQYAQILYLYGDIAYEYQFSSIYMFSPENPGKPISIILA